MIRIARLKKYVSIVGLNVWDSLCSKAYQRQTDRSSSIRLKQFSDKHIFMIIKDWSKLRLEIYFKCDCINVFAFCSNFP